MNTNTAAGQTTGTTTRTGGPLSAAAGTPVCAQETFTKVEDRPVVKEVKTYVKEHHPIEKQFVVETRPTGQEREVASGRTTEVVDSNTRVVDVAQSNPCAGVPTSGTGSAAGKGTGVSSGTGVRSGMTTTDKVESYVPGTTEHRAVQGETGPLGAGMGHTTTGTGHTTSAGHTGTSTGAETGHHAGIVEKIKAKVPGTAENKAAKAEQGRF